MDNFGFNNRRLFWETHTVFNVNPTFIFNNNIICLKQTSKLIYTLWKFYVCIFAINLSLLNIVVKTKKYTMLLVEFDWHSAREGWGDTERGLSSLQAFRYSANNGEAAGGSHCGWVVATWNYSAALTDLSTIQDFCFRKKLLKAVECKIC